MGRLPPADWRVKRNRPDREGGGRQAEQTGPSIPANRAPACRQAGRIGDGEVACLRLPVATRRQTGATCLPPPVCVRTRTGRRRGRQAHRQVKEGLRRERLD